MKKLTSTSYALLGLLAIRPWSAYQLTAHMKRSSIRLIWPRAESKLYQEPKNLLAHGLATAAEQRQGRRRRTVYRITPEGRQALSRWLSEEGTELLLEFETMLKVAYADFGTRDQLLDNISRIRDSVIRHSRLAAPLAREIAEAGPKFPQRAHVNALVERFLVEMIAATLNWADWAEEIVSGWPETKLDDAMASQARTLLRENADALEEIAAGGEIPNCEALLTKTLLRGLREGKELSSIGAIGPQENERE